MAKSSSKKAGKRMKAAALILAAVLTGGLLSGCSLGNRRPIESRPAAAESVQPAAKADTTAPEIQEIRTEFPVGQRVYPKELVRVTDDVDRDPSIRITAGDGDAEAAADGAYVIFKNAGSFSIEVTAEDSSGNAAKAVLKVTAYNKVLPQLTLLYTELEITDAVKTYDFSKNASAKSPIYGDLTDKIKVDDSQVVFGKAGNYKVVYSVEDKDGNKRTASLIVRIRDTAAPVIKLAETEYTVTIGEKKPDYLKGVTASDKTDGDVTSKIKVDDTAVKYDTAGSYSLVYLVADEADNLAKVEVRVTVKKPQPTPAPTTTPTAVPTAEPEPTKAPEPTAEPTEIPEPTAEPAAAPTIEPADVPEAKDTFILDTGLKVYHRPGCARIDILKDRNRQEYNGTESSLKAEGYAACDLCRP